MIIKRKKKEENKNMDEDIKKEEEQNNKLNENKENIEKKDENEQNKENIENKELILEKAEEIKEENNKNDNLENKDNIIEEEDKKENVQKIEENKNNENLDKNDIKENVEEINTTEEKKEKEKEENIKENEMVEEEDEEEKYEEIKESTSTYILKYSRKNNEPRESSYDRELIKSKHCLFMIEFKIIKKKEEKFLLLYCHEIAAIYFDEIYEKTYSVNDLYKENRHFRIFDDIEEAKNIIDEILNNNSSNSKKIFIDLQDNTFRLHLKITFFDKENEVIFNVPKKNINDKERIRILPDFLKEIQIKMNHLEDENKKLKNENRNMGGENEFFGSTGKNNSNNEENDFFGSKNDTSSNTKKVKSSSGKGYKKKLIKK